MVHCAYEDSTFPTRNRVAVQPYHGHRVDQWSYLRCLPKQTAFEYHALEHFVLTLATGRVRKVSPFGPAM